MADKINKAHKSYTVTNTIADKLDSLKSKNFNNIAVNNGITIGENNGSIVIEKQTVNNVNHYVHSDDSIKYDKFDTNINKNVRSDEELNQTQAQRSVHLVDIERHLFDVSFTFAGETRGYVEKVLENLENTIDKNSIFYDNYYQSQLARPSIDILLQDIYRNRSKLIVVFLCEKYQEKEWCRIEFKTVRDIIKQKGDKKIMYIKVDDGKVDGVLSVDGYIDWNKSSPKEIAEYIYERIYLLDNQV